MDRIHLKLLDSFFSELSATLNLRYLFRHLTDRNLITCEEEQQLQKLLKAEDSQPDLERTANITFLKILKTKGSKAFELFLQALKDEEKHLGHNDLHHTLSQHDKRSRSGSSSSVFEPGVDEQKQDHFQPNSDTIRYASDSSAGYSSITTDSHWEYRDIKQYLSQIERTVGENSAEIARLNKELKISYSKIMAAIMRPSSASGDGDDSSGSSETSLHQKSTQLRQKSVRKGPIVATESDVSLHSAQEEETKPESIKMLLPQEQKLPKVSLQPIRLVSIICMYSLRIPVLYTCQYHAGLRL